MSMYPLNKTREKHWISQCSVLDFLIEKSDDLAEKIILLLKNQELIESMGEKSIEKVQKFSWHQVVKDILGVVKNN